MERFIKVNEDVFYDCVQNRLVRESNSMHEEVETNACIFVPPFDNNTLTCNLKNCRKQLILSVTENCNFRCEYCIYHEQRYVGEKNLLFMPYEVAKKAIDEFISTSSQSDEIAVCFYGGEPLVNFPLIEKCVNYIVSKNLNKKILYVVTTNATLIDTYIAEFLYKHHFIVNISLDGAKGVNDLYRKYVDGRPTFDDIIRGARTLIDTNPIYWEGRLNFSCVKSPIQEYSPILDFFEIAPYGYSVSNMVVTNYMSEILKEAWNKTRDDELQDFSGYKRMAATEDDTILVAKYKLQQGIKGNVLCPGGYCMPLVKRTFVAANGDYHICEKIDQIPKNAVGNVEEGMNVEKIVNLATSVLDFHNKNCKTCWAVRFCPICFAALDKFPKECEHYKNRALFFLRNIALETKNNV